MALSALMELTCTLATQKQKAPAATPEILGRSHSYLMNELFFLQEKLNASTNEELLRQTRSLK
jgi:hypothetical protein